MRSGYESLVDRYEYLHHTDYHLVLNIFINIVIWIWNNRNGVFFLDIIVVVQTWEVTDACTVRRLNNSFHELIFKLIEDYSNPILSKSTGCPTTNRRCWFWITDKRLKIIQVFLMNWCSIFRVLFKTKIKHFWQLVISQLSKRILVVILK